MVVPGGPGPFLALASSTVARATEGGLAGPRRGRAASVSKCRPGLSAIRLSRARPCRAGNSESARRGRRDSDSAGRRTRGPSSPCWPAPVTRRAGGRQPELRAWARQRGGAWSRPKPWARARAHRPHQAGLASNNKRSAPTGSALRIHARRSVERPWRWLVAARAITTGRAIMTAIFTGGSTASRVLSRYTEPCCGVCNAVVVLEDLKLHER